MSGKKLNLEISVNSIKLVGGALLTVVILLIIILTGINSFNGGENPSSTNNEITEVYRSLSPQAQALYYKQSEELTKPVAARLVELDQKTIGCFAPSSIMDMSDNDENLGGQCCGALTDVEAYELQMVALKKFIEKHGSSDLIPSDPYDVTVKHAKKLTTYDEIELTGDEQKIYDEAMECLTMADHVVVSAGNGT